MGAPADVLGGFHGFLDRSDCFIKIDDDALARAARFRYAVPAIAQAGVSDLGDQRAGLCAAYIDGRQ